MLITSVGQQRNICTFHIFKLSGVVEETGGQASQHTVTRRAFLKTTEEFSDPQCSSHQLFLTIFVQSRPTYFFLLVEICLMCPFPPVCCIRRTFKNKIFLIRCQHRPGFFPWYSEGGIPGKRGLCQQVLKTQCECLVYTLWSKIIAFLH